MDDDWKAICQATYKGVEGAVWENLKYKFVDKHKEVNVRNSSGSSRAKTLWNMRDAKERSVAHHDQTSEQKIVHRDAVRQEARSSTAGGSRK